jgi:hypothetical protein
MIAKHLFLDGLLLLAQVVNLKVYHILPCFKKSIFIFNLEILYCLFNSFHYLDFHLRETYLHHSILQVNLLFLMLFFQFFCTPFLHGKWNYFIHFYLIFLKFYYLSLLLSNFQVFIIFHYDF